jgi:hypothetical protein
VTTVDEGALRFDFEEGWDVTKWDSSRVYVEGLQRLTGTVDARSEGTKAVDFVGVHDARLYFFEVKDFRGHRIENGERQRSELPLEIGLKVRDTLAGIAGAYTKTGGPEWVERCGRALSARKSQVQVIVWIADDPPGPTEPRGKRAVRDSVRQKEISQKLAWLTSRVWVEDPRNTRLPGVSAQNLPGAGQR